MLFISFVIVVVGGYGYKNVALNHEAAHYEYGFYPYENLNGLKMRWIGQKDFWRGSVRGDLLNLDIYAMPYNIHSGGLNLRLFLNGRLVDEVKFAKSEKKHLQYHIANQRNELVEVKMVVDRTFNPSRLRMNTDTRNLGIMVSEI